MTYYDLHTPIMTPPLSCKLLIFEDDFAIRGMLVAYFTAQGATVVAAPDGKDALIRIQAERPEIIILDVVMPHQDGLTVLQQLRQVDTSTPVIMLTDRSGEDDKVTGLDFGADDYVTKPFSPKELLARVKVQVRRNSPNGESKNPPLTIGPVTITPAAREANLPDQARIPLTKTEFDLLHYLASRSLTVVTHGELLKEVLGYEPDTETKSLVMHIANIRRKLEIACPKALSIKAVAGVGYKLILGDLP